MAVSIAPGIHKQKLTLTVPVTPPSSHAIIRSKKSCTAGLSIRSTILATMSGMVCKNLTICSRANQQPHAQARCVFAAPPTSALRQPM